MEARGLLRDNITKLLRDQVLAMRSDEPVRLSPERELAVSFGASRLSLRSAMQALVDEGLLMRKQGSGTYILPEIRLAAIHVFKAPDIRRDDPFYTAFLAELSSSAKQESLHLHFVDDTRLTGKRVEVPLIIVGVIRRQLLQSLQQVYRNVIAVNAVRGVPNITQVTIDDYEVGYYAAVKLLEHKHRHMLLMSGPPRFLAAENRKRGFLDALGEHDIVPTEYQTKMNFRGGYQAGDFFIDRYSSISSGRPTAAFLVNDWMAIGMMHRLLAAGIRIPEDVSMIGCDDVPLASQVVPALSTFKWDLPALLSETIEIAKAMHESNSLIRKKVLLNAPYIDRNTVQDAQH